MHEYNFSIDLPGVKADSFEEAKQKAYKMLNDLAESNDGSEFLANAELTYRGASHGETPTKSVGNCHCRASDSGKS